ncbi:MAG: general secretion pathway protein K [Halioglobus sp.]|jgi:general secretion pathway protein K
MRNDSLGWCRVIAPRSGQVGSLPSRQSGVALAILVWFLAAMSILVGGMVMQARVDVKLTQLHASRARVEAAADGGIQLVLAELIIKEQEGEFDRRAIHHGQRTLGNLNVAVSLTPLTGLIDLNMAPEDLLLTLFSSVTEEDENVAEELALSVIEWRTESQDAGQSVGNDTDELGVKGTAEGGSDNAQLRGAGMRYGRFEAIEDLLLVPGIDRRIFDAVRESVYVSQEGQAGVDWVSAPAGVLRALGVAEEAAAVDIIVSRAELGSQEQVAPDDIDLSFQENADMPSYRVDALVKTDETVYRRRRWVNRSQPGADGLPWNFFRTEAVMVASAAESGGMALLEGFNAGN